MAKTRVNERKKERAGTVVEEGGERTEIERKVKERRGEREDKKRVHRGHRAWRVRKNKESPLITQWGVPRNAYTSVTSLITM